MTEFSEEEIRAVIDALEKNSDTLSDGFGYYTPSIVDGKFDPQKGYDKEMRRIAIDILKAQKKAHE